MPEQPFPLATDYTQPNGHDPLSDAPDWFRAWRDGEFVPFKLAVTKKLSSQDKLLSVARYVGIGVASVAVARFPDLKEWLGPLLTGLLGAG